jgi:ATP-dependent Clp protease adaptor protein ClpS
MNTPTIEDPFTVIAPEDTSFSLPRYLPNYAVVLHNDPINTFDFVIKVLQKVLGCGYLKAFGLTFKAHATGRSVVWTGDLEVAELRADQIVSCGPDPARVMRGAQPLRVTVEPLPPC